jgi:hypothetical protein
MSVSLCTGDALQLFTQLLLYCFVAFHAGLLPLNSGVLLSIIKVFVVTVWQNSR